MTCLVLSTAYSLLQARQTVSLYENVPLPVFLGLLPILHSVFANATLVAMKRLTGLCNAELEHISCTLCHCNIHVHGVA